MSVLAKKACTACQVGVPLVSESEAAEWLTQIPGWQLIKVDGINHLKRIFTFSDFKQAMAFANQVGELAETYNHHPEIVVEWGRVTVSWWTHKIKGLHENDFVMAAKCDELLD